MPLGHSRSNKRYSTSTRSSSRGRTSTKSRETPSSRSLTALHIRSSSVARHLNKHYGLDTEALGLVERAWSGRDGSKVDDAAAARCLKRQEIVQEHFSYEPGKVSLHDTALVMGYVSGLGKDAQLAVSSAQAANYMRSASIGVMRLCVEEVEKKGLNARNMYSYRRGGSVYDDAEVLDVSETHLDDRPTY
ncbi:hypothetical protein EDB86DRAFT_2829031 [Lactarius hatsudake]|nr:hypothetical protein EDB86DRAFT_2829031 [Lactarius hatsudake]